jgi:hypothetical protein
MDFPMPEFKFVYCSQLMINQIENAFANREVSFSEELDIAAILEGEKTIVKYHHSFNNISFFQKGGASKSLVEESKDNPKNFQSISSVFLKNRKLMIYFDSFRLIREKGYPVQEVVEPPHF